MSFRLSQCEQILSLFRQSPDGIVSCRIFERHCLYHKLSSRLSDLKKKGYSFRLIPSPTADPLDICYELVSSPSAKPAEFIEEPNGQMMAFQDTYEP